MQSEQRGAEGQHERKNNIGCDEQRGTEGNHTFFMCTRTRTRTLIQTRTHKWTALHRRDERGPQGMCIWTHRLLQVRTKGGLYADDRQWHVHWPSAIRFEGFTHNPLCNTHTHLSEPPLPPLPWCVQTQMDPKLTITKAITKKQYESKFLLVSSTKCGETTEAIGKALMEHASHLWKSRVAAHKDEKGPPCMFFFSNVVC